MDGSNRFNPPDDGKQLILNERDLLWMQKLHRHGPLPSRFLKAFTNNVTVGAQHTKERLTQLTARHDTIHAGPYLFRPDQQMATYRALSNYMVHDLTPRGRLALADAGMLTDHAPAHHHGRQWTHDFMLSCFTASIELAVQERPGYQYIFHDEICEKIGGPLEFKIDYRDEGNRAVKALLKPDRAFGIRYPNGTYRRFLIEADRGTEKFKPSQGRKTAVDNLLQYTDFIGEGKFRDALHVTGGLVLIYLMTSPGKMRNMQEYLKELTGPCNYIAFKSLDGFGNVLRPPPPMPELFTTPFERAGMEGFVIAK